ncbi:hypothetical protein D9M71_422040 [compost metagenome]
MRVLWSPNSTKIVSSYQPPSRAISISRPMLKSSRRTALYWATLREPARCTSSSDRSRTWKPSLSRGMVKGRWLPAVWMKAKNGWSFGSWRIRRSLSLNRSRSEMPQTSTTGALQLRSS